MPRSRRTPRRSRRARRQGSRRRRPWVRWACGMALVYVLAVNAAVRVCGGSRPALLSLSHLADKSHALARLGVHSLRHVWGDPHPPVEHALREACRREQLPYSFAMSVARAESSLDPHSISATGAMGLMQLMPTTAAELGVRDPFDSLDNATGGASYLAALWRRYQGDRARVVAAYNAGPGRVPRRGRVRGLPAETQHYVQRVLGRPGEVWLARGCP